MALLNGQYDIINKRFFMKATYKLFFTLCLLFSSSIFAKQILIEVVNNTMNNCFCIETITTNGYILDYSTRIPRGGKGFISLAHNIFSKQPHSEITFMCAAKTVTVVAEDTTGIDGTLNLNAYFLRSDDSITANVNLLDNRTKKNKPTLGRITITNPN